MKKLTLFITLFLVVTACEKANQTKDEHPYDTDAIKQISEIHYQWCYANMLGKFDDALNFVEIPVNQTDFGLMTFTMENDLEIGLRWYYSFNSIDVIAFEEDTQSGYLVGAFIKGNYVFSQTVNGQETTDNGVFYSAVLNDGPGHQNNWKLNLFHADNMPSWWLNNTGSGGLVHGTTQIRMLQ